MNLIHQTSCIALFATSILFLGCNSEVGSSSEFDVIVQGLTESKTVVACTVQNLQAVADIPETSTSEFSWNIAAPKDAAFDFQPAGSKLRFVARTTGEYLINATNCVTGQAAGEDCIANEFAITVVTGPDSNGNGIGDLCETSTCIPACDGRTCGLDPICNVSCGTCATGTTCNDDSGTCEAECVPACDGRTCGLDPICHKSCGSCATGSVCDEEKGTCNAECVPACDGRVCGLDPICNTSCGTCSDGNSCNAEGQCQPTNQPGRVVTIVMALTDSRLGYTDPHFHQRARLIEQSVQWVSPVESPRVLVVLDDNCSNWTKEARLIQTTLKRRGFIADYLLEPANGLTASALDGYDVIWLSNPALPVDDPMTVETLTKFAKTGGGLVLQGDDITQPTSMQVLTRLRNISTGKSYCGLTIDDDRGASYKVTVESTNHPVTSGLHGNRYYYGDDIDTSIVSLDSNTNVLAWATASGGCSFSHPHRTSGTNATCKAQPVIVAYEMTQQ